MTKKLISLLAVVFILISCFAGCENKDSQPTEPAILDYATEVKLDLASNETVKVELTTDDIKAFIDGDTTHFYVPSFSNGVLKARYLGVDTPESTGKIEVWGKKASKFTRSALESAESIVIESDNAQWNADSTGSRYLVWVWYKPEGAAAYRNLNIDLLQNGLSWASKAENNRYGQTCMAAIQQAKAQGLHVYSDEEDPDFYYGEAQPVDLKTLRTSPELYQNTKVVFDATITNEGGQSVYVEDYDEQTDMYFGMSVYYGYGHSGEAINILKPGNRVRFVGSLQYWEQGGTWQISDIQYIDMRPNDPNNIQLISENNEPANTLIRPDDLKGTMDLEALTSLEDGATEVKTFKLGDLALSTSVSLENLYVTGVSTTENEESANFGAMTLKCRIAGQGIDVRTAVLRDAEGNTITAEAYEGQTINVQGIVDYYNGSYQIKVFSQDNIQIVE